MIYFLRLFRPVIEPGYVRFTPQERCSFVFANDEGTAKELVRQAELKVHFEKKMVDLTYYSDADRFVFPVRTDLLPACITETKIPGADLQGTDYIVPYDPGKDLADIFALMDSLPYIKQLRSASLFDVRTFPKALLADIEAECIVFKLVKAA